MCLFRVISRLGICNGFDLNNNILCKKLNWHLVLTCLTACFETKRFRFLLYALGRNTSSLPQYMMIRSPQTVNIYLKVAGIRTMAPVQNKTPLKDTRAQDVKFSFKKRNYNSLVVILLSKVGENEFFSDFIAN